MNITNDNELIQQYNSLLNTLTGIFVNTKINDSDKYVTDELTELQNIVVEDKYNKTILFFNTIINENMFALFSSSKIKLFSHKSHINKQISICLLNENIPFKKLLNNQSESVKQTVWTELYKLYIAYENDKNESNRNHENINIINNILEENTKNITCKFNTSITKDKIKEILQLDLNNKSSELIDDVIDSIESIITSNDGGNPITKIIKITEEITNKYSDLLKNGDIKLDNIINYLMSKSPGIENLISSFMNDSNPSQEQQILLDDNFSTSNVTVGSALNKPSSNFNVGNILKMINPEMLSNFGINLTK